MSELKAPKRPTRRAPEGPALVAVDGARLLVDPEDFWLLHRHRWKPYAQAKAGAKAHYATLICGRQVYLSHMVMGMPNRAESAAGLVLMYLNGDTLDNRKRNLAWVTESVVRHRMVRPKRGGPSSSQFIGVTFDQKAKRFRAAIGVDGAKILLGTFREEVEAAKAYDRAALKHFGIYARLNFSPGEKP